MHTQNTHCAYAPTQFIAHTHTYMRINYVDIYTYINMHTQKKICTRAHAHKDIHVYSYKDIQYMYTHIKIYILIHIHIYKHAH